MEASERGIAVSKLVVASLIEGQTRVDFRLCIKGAPRCTLVHLTCAAKAGSSLTPNLNPS